MSTQGMDTQSVSTPHMNANPRTPHSMNTRGDNTQGMNTHGDKILHIHQLTIRLPLNSVEIVHAVTEVSLDLAAGELLAIIGESGSGKSMIGSAIVGTLPTQAMFSGQALFYPNDAPPVDLLKRHWPHTSLPPTDSSIAGRKIALIPQSAATFLTPVRTVGSQLQETMLALSYPGSAADLLHQAELHSDILGMFPHELSGGMAQRVAIAFALAGDPQLIIADEPTASLDPHLTMHFLRLLRGIADCGKGVIIITHDISDLRDSQVADRIAVMYASRCEEIGEATSVLTQPRSSYMRDFLRSLPENGMHPMPGATPSLINLPEDYCYEKRLSDAAAGLYTAAESTPHTSPHQA